MRAGLDTSALNWLADNAWALDPILAARGAGLLEVIVTPEAADEIRRTPDPGRNKLLEDALSRFFPLTPTHVPRLGSMRLGRARLPTQVDETRLDAIGFLRDRTDRDLATNAAGYGCDVFVTRDGEMVRQKKERLEAELGNTRVVSPEQFLGEVRGLLEGSGGAEIT
jgi:hypothetical protein